MNKRKAEMIDMKTSNSLKTRIIFKTPSRGQLVIKVNFLQN